MITVILSFLKLLTLEKTTTFYFQYFRKSARKLRSKDGVMEELRVHL